MRHTTRWTPAATLMLALASTSLPAAEQNLGPLPSFQATALSGESVSEAQLLGQPTVLVVTPSRDASEETKAWAKALMDALDPQQVRVRDVIAIDLPFFMSEQDALDRARDKIPQRFHDKTWLLAEPVLEQALDIPTESAQAWVLVFDARGKVVTRVHGAATDARVEQVQQAVASLTR